jgi:hypothetical protein
MPTGLQEIHPQMCRRSLGFATRFSLGKKMKTYCRVANIQTIIDIPYNIFPKSMPSTRHEFMDSYFKIRYIKMKEEIIEN